eukprot:CAMPEP_0196720290 /NCGR_PEP_ID=MMETSP1091-20130531/3102_1 /TAXON_ID=302021 /ORGANISM="Rhodomonas sp., Strain CCMP768" /LENGTH=311 /DNA_ID=CAMNT_0042061467 /DNA_START=48 /DNA_END=983 /DNA_ORIENTATION=+
MINMNRHVLLSESLSNLQGQDPAVPADIERLPGWAYAAMPSNLRRTVTDVARGRTGASEKASQLITALPELASMALPSRATREVSVLWGLSPPIGVLGAVVSTTIRLGRFCGVDVFEDNGTDLQHQNSLKCDRRPAHHAALRLDCLEVKQLRPESEVEGGTEDIPLCAICQVDFEVGEYAYAFRECKHAFHVKCLNQWLERGDSCPCCRCKLGVLKDADLVMLTHLGQLNHGHIRDAAAGHERLDLALPGVSEEEEGHATPETSNTASSAATASDRNAEWPRSSVAVQKEEQLRMPCVRVDEMAVPCGNEE